MRDVLVFTHDACFIDMSGIDPDSNVAVEIKKLAELASWVGRQPRTVSYEVEERVKKGFEKFESGLTFEGEMAINSGREGKKMDEYRKKVIKKPATVSVGAYIRKIVSILRVGRGLEAFFGLS